MTDRTIGPTGEDSRIADRTAAGDDPADDPANDPAGDRAQHASADAAPELFGW